MGKIGFPMATTEEAGFRHVANPDSLVHGPNNVRQKVCHHKWGASVLSFQRHGCKEGTASLSQDSVSFTENPDRIPRMPMSRLKHDEKPSLLEFPVMP
jgi:hypothetical protein